MCENPVCVCKPCACTPCHCNIEDSIAETTLYFGPPNKRKGNTLIYEKNRPFNAKIQEVEIGPNVTGVELVFVFYNETESLVIMEIPVLAEEIGNITHYLLSFSEYDIMGSENGIVSAIHNHHVLDEPKIYYIHFQMKASVSLLVKNLSVLWNDLSYLISL